MRGIAGITGPSSPLIGQDAFYEVTKLYPGTVISNYSAVQWKVYREAAGQWVELKGTLKTGKRVSFNFPQKWYGRQLLIEAYLNNPEKKSPPGLIIKPRQGEKKVKSVELRDANDKAFTQKPKYGQSVTARILTENMLGDTLKLSIWERDTLTSTGHDPNGNVKLWSGTIKVTETNGLAKKKILLSPAMMAESNKSYFEGGEHEYYMLVEAANTRAKISGETAVQNEILLSPGPSGGKPATAPKPQSAPSPTLAESAMEYLKQLKIDIVNALSIDEMPGTGQTSTTVNTNKAVNCGERYCIKKGSPNSDFIREINIRLSGFGGNVPTDEFTDRTEKMVKQFQKDYMNVPETGKVCGNVLKAIEDFQTKFTFNFESIQCKCGTCTGFGDNSHKGEYLRGTAEAHHRYEYPGLHRSLLWSLKAVVFYLQKDGRYSLNKISSGYRCRYHEEYKKRPTTNHMGKALDLHFNKQGARTREVSDVETIRADIFNKYLGAKWDWSAEKDIFYLESTRVGATTWVHYDVREFNPANYLQDKFFAKTPADMNGENIILLAQQAGHTETCRCMQPSAQVENVATTGGCYCDRDLTSDELVTLGVSRANADKFLEAINDTMTEYTINTCERKLHFLAQLRHESGEFVHMEEIASGKKYEGREDLGNTETGDGVRFKGRGLIQITGRTNYKNYGTYKSDDFTTEPDNKKLADLPYCVDSAGWYWSKNLSVDLNDYADKDDIIYISYRINGGFNGYIDDRKPKLIDMIKKINCTKTKFENYETYSIKTSKAWDGHDAVYKYARLNTSESKECYQRYLDLTAEYLTWNSVKRSRDTKQRIETRRRTANENI